MALRRPLRRTERGAAAVEAGLLTAFLSPLLLGVLGMGDALWWQQRSGEYEPRVSQSAVVGVYTDCEQLLAVVKDTVRVNLDNVSGTTGVALDDITAEVVDFVPEQLGVDVRVSVRVGSGSWLPFDDGYVVDADLRLLHARLDLESC